ncbi:MAG: MG2 domain-containing protein, partial [Janthinobacterium lividum]
MMLSAGLPATARGATAAVVDAANSGAAAGDQGFNHDSRPGPAAAAAGSIKVVAKGHVGAGSAGTAAAPSDAARHAAAAGKAQAAAPASPAIASFSPQGEVAQVRQARVRFTAAMVAAGAAGADLASAPSPFDIDCTRAGGGNSAPAGHGRWIDERNWVFDFEQSLAPGMRCVFQARPALRSLAGFPLAGRTRAEFTTGGPAVVQVLPHEGSRLSEDQMFVLVHNGPVSDASVLAHAYCAVAGIGERIAVQLVAGVLRKDLLQQQVPDIDARLASTVQCRQRLPNGAAMQLVWDPGVRSESGMPGGAAQRFAFEVRPAFSVSIECERENANADCSPLAPLRLRFNAPVARRQAREILFIGADGSQRKPVFASSERGAEVDAIEFRPPLPARATFSIQLPPTLQDSEGRLAENRADFPLRGRIADYPPLAKFAAAPFGILELNADPVLPVTVRRLEDPILLRSTDGARAPAALASLRVEGDAAIIAWLGRLARFHEKTIEPGSLGGMAGAAANGSAGLPVVPAAAIGNGAIDTRAIGLLANEAGVTRIALPTSLPAPQVQAGAAASQPAQAPSPAAAPAAVPATGHPATVASGQAGLAAAPSGPAPARILPGTDASATSGNGDGMSAFEVLGIPFNGPGFHVLEIESPRLGASLLGKPVPMYVRTSVLVTNLAVHLKIRRENGIVWVTTLDGAQPVANADVRVSDCRARLLWQGRTGADGIAHLPAGLDGNCSLHGSGTAGQGAGPGVGPFDGLFVSARATDARGRGDMAFALSTWNNGIEAFRFNLASDTGTAGTRRVHTVFDRTLLRAGETVSMKHFMRLETMHGFAMPDVAQRPNRMRIVHQGSNEEFRFALAWDRQGSALSSFAIPPTARLGSYQVTLDRGPVGDGNSSAGSSSTDSSGAGTAGPPASAQPPGNEESSFASGSFRVEEFRLPLMAGSISAPKGELVSPRELTLALQLGYLNGGVAAGQAVTLTSLLRRHAPQWPGLEAFSFQASLDEGTDDQRIIADKLAVRLDASGAGQATVRPLPKLATPMLLQNEMQYADPNGEIQTVAAPLVLWPSAVVVGVKTQDWVAARGKLALTAITLDTGGRPLANVPVDLLGTAVQNNSSRKRLVGGFYGYENTRVARPLGRLCSGTSNAQGLLRCDVAVKDSGQIEITARARDGAGHMATAMTSAWMAEAGESWFAQQNQDRMELLPEKKQYEAGQTAVFQVRMPFLHATALVAIEREGVIDTRVVELTSRDPVIRLPVLASYGPNVYVSVLALRGRVRSVPWHSFFSRGWKSPLAWWGDYRESSAAGAPSTMVDLAKPAFKLGIAEIAVGSAAHKLDVKVLTDRASYAVRAHAKVKVLVKRPDGRAAAGAHIAVAAVDEALLALQPNHSWDLLDAMLQRRAYGVETATAQMQVIGKRHFGRKAAPAGGGGGRAATRELFDTLLLWRGEVLLDGTGRAEIDVPLNDALSGFRIVAIADDGESLFGHGYASIRTTQDLQIIAGLPPLVREGDRYTAMASVRNTTARAMEVDVGASLGTVQREGSVMPAAPALAQPATLAVQRFRLAPGEMRELTWPVLAPALPSAQETRLNWEFVAQERLPAGVAAASQPARDALRFSQRLVTAVPVTVRQASLFQLDGAARVTVAAPAQALAGRSSLSVTLTPQLSGGLAAVQAWFAAYPYNCLEQKISRAIGLHDRAAWNRVMTELPAYLDADGLAYFYPPSAPAGPGAGHAAGSDALTAYLLAAAHEAGLAVPQASRERMLRGLAAFVEGRLMRPAWAPHADLDVRKLAALETLARYGQAQPRMLGSIQLAPNRWPSSALLDWMSLLVRLDGIPDAGVQLAQADAIMRSRLRFQGTRTLFATESTDAWWWLMTGADVNASRLLLTVLERADWQADIARLATGTLGRQLHGAWRTTTANVWGTLALEKFSARFESTAPAGVTTAGLQPGPVQAERYTWPGSTPGRASGSAAIASAFPGTATSSGGTSWQLHLPEALETPAVLELTHVGKGKPWVSLQTRAAVPVTQAVSSGFRLRRSMQPETTLHAGVLRGHIVRVELEIDASADMTGVVVSDAL